MHRPIVECSSQQSISSSHDTGITRVISFVHVDRYDNRDHPHSPGPPEQPNATRCSSADLFRMYEEGPANRNHRTRKNDQRRSIDSEERIFNTAMQIKKRNRRRRTRGLKSGTFGDSSVQPTKRRRRKGFIQRGSKNEASRRARYYDVGSISNIFRDFVKSAANPIVGSSGVTPHGHSITDSLRISGPAVAETKVLYNSGPDQDVTDDPHFPNDIIRKITENKVVLYNDALTSWNDRAAKKEYTHELEKRKKDVKKIVDGSILASAYRKWFKNTEISSENHAPIWDCHLPFDNTEYDQAQVDFMTFSVPLMFADPDRVEALQSGIKRDSIVTIYARPSEYQTSTGELPSQPGEALMNSAADPRCQLNFVDSGDREDTYSSNVEVDLMTPEIMDNIERYCLDFYDWNVTNPSNAPEDMVGRAATPSAVFLVNEWRKTLKSHLQNHLNAARSDHNHSWVFDCLDLESVFDRLITGMNGSLARLANDQSDRRGAFCRTELKQWKTEKDNKRQARNARREDERRKGKEVDGDDNDDEDPPDFSSRFKVNPGELEVPDQFYLDNSQRTAFVRCLSVLLIFAALQAYMEAFGHCLQRLPEKRKTTIEYFTEYAFPSDMIDILMPSFASGSFTPLSELLEEHMRLHGIQSSVQKCTQILQPRPEGPSWNDRVLAPIHQERLSRSRVCWRASPDTLGKGLEEVCEIASKNVAKWLANYHQFFYNYRNEVHQHLTSMTATTTENLRNAIDDDNQITNTEEQMSQVQARGAKEIETWSTKASEILKRVEAELNNQIGKAEPLLKMISHLMRSMPYPDYQRWASEGRDSMTLGRLRDVATNPKDLVKSIIHLSNDFLLHSMVNNEIPVVKGLADLNEVPIDQLILLICFAVPMSTISPQTESSTTFRITFDRTVAKRHDGDLRAGRFSDRAAWREDGGYHDG